MDTKQQIADRIAKANNILVTVSANPSVDQLAACIGLTLVCNKLGKHATAVFSGQVPPIISFLEPEKTIEKNTDSLRDFIIALDKAKADKLRYKVEDKVVKIFITPYKTSISDKDLQFSQGDFNVDVIIAIGVHSQADLDQAITSHGRILHDATLATLNTRPGGELGGINWLDSGASSLSEMTAALVDTIDKKMTDDRVATAFLTGIVSETERFSNAKTSPQTMSISAELMSRGANQQLVASKLENPAPAAPSPIAAQAGQTPANSTKADDGTLEIEHADKQAAEADKQKAEDELTPQIHIDDQGELHLPELNEEPAPAQLPEPAIASEPQKPAEGEGEAKPEQPLVKLDGAPQSHVTEGSHLILTPPTFESELTANTSAEDEEQPSGNPLTLPAVEQPMPLLHREPLGASTTGRTIEPPKEENAPAELSKPSDSPALATTNNVAGLDADTLAQLSQPTPSADVSQPAVTPTMPVVPTVPADEVAVPLTLPTPSLTPPVPIEPAQTMPETVTPTDIGGADLSSARAAVNQAVSQSDAANPAPIQALNAQTLGAPLHDGAAQPPLDGVSPSTGQPVQATPTDPNSPPPVPPPMLPQM